MSFPRWFLELLVSGGLLLTVASALVLVGLLVKDWRENTLW